MRGCMGDEYIPPATPRKSVLIYVTFGDLLKASQQNAGSKGGRGYRYGKGWRVRGTLALRCPVTQPLADGPDLCGGA